MERIAWKNKNIQIEWGISMGAPKRKHKSKLIEAEALFEQSIVKEQSKFYFKCETEIGICNLTISAPTLSKALEKLVKDCKPIRVHSVREEKKTIH